MEPDRGTGGWVGDGKAAAPSTDVLFPGARVFGQRLSAAQLCSYKNRRRSRLRGKSLKTLYLSVFQGCVVGITIPQMCEEDYYSVAQVTVWPESGAACRI